MDRSATSGTRRRQCASLRKTTPPEVLRPAAAAAAYLVPFGCAPPGPGGAIGYGNEPRVLEAVGGLVPMATKRVAKVTPRETSDTLVLILIPWQKKKKYLPLAP